MKKAGLLIAAALAVLASAAAAQLVPGVPSVGGVLAPVLPLVDTATRLPDRAARTLATVRLDRIRALVRANPDRIALDPDGFPARAQEVVTSDPDDALIVAAEARGYRLIERGDLLGIGFARFAVPEGRSLKAAIRDLGRLGAKDVSADQLHFESGMAGPAVAPRSGFRPADRHDRWRRGGRGRPARLRRRCAACERSRHRDRFLDRRARSHRAARFPVRGFSRRTSMALIRRAATP